MGASAWAGSTLTEARDHLYESMLLAHPQLVGTRVDRVWGGRVALTLDRLPHCGRVDRRWYATGCNGSGVALNTWMGHRMAGAICGDELPPFAELRHRPIPMRSTAAGVVARRGRVVPGSGLGLDRSAALSRGRSTQVRR